jgi:talin
MARNISSLIKTVKTIEDENSRGTRALETAIEAIGHDLETFNSKDVPQNKVSAEELIKVTRPLTIATGKAVSAGNSLKQDDIVAAANTGRQAISDLLITCKVRLHNMANLYKMCVLYILVLLIRCF